MFDRTRLFKVLYYLSNENSKLLIAQDAYPTLKSCINQMENIWNTLILEDNQVEIASEEEKESRSHAMSNLLCMKLISAEWIEILSMVLPLAGTLFHY